MRWMSWAYRVGWPRGDARSPSRGLLLVALVALSAVAGCATPTAPVAQRAPGLYFTLDGNFIAARSLHDLRYTLVALGASDGHVAWRHTLEASNPADATGALSQPVYRNGLVYLGYYYDHATDPQNIARHGVVEALAATTGAARWRREIGTEIAGDPVVDGATVYISALVTQGQPPVAETGLLEALDAQTGAVRWKRALGNTPSMVAVADGRVFVMEREQFSGHLLALHASDGSVAWDYASDAPLSRGGDAENGRSDAPLVAAGRVFAQATERNPDGTANLMLLALDASDGSVVWQRQTGGIAATPAFTQDGATLCLSAYDSLAGTSAILGLATSSGATRWSVTGIEGIVSGCVSSGDTFYLTQGARGGATGSVFALSGQDGRQLWKTTTGAPVVADGLIAPAVSEGVVGVYLQGAPATRGPLMSTMAALRVSDGKLLWRRDYAGRPEHSLDIEGDQVFNPELSGDLPVVTAYARLTGATLWSYALGRL